MCTTMRVRGLSTVVGVWRAKVVRRDQTGDGCGVLLVL